MRSFFRRRAPITTAIAPATLDRIADLLALAEHLRGDAPADAFQRANALALRLGMELPADLAILVFRAAHGVNSGDRTAAWEAVEAVRVAIGASGRFDAFVDGFWAGPRIERK